MPLLPGYAKFGPLIGPRAPVVPPFVNDTFTDVAETALQNHVGELGAAWALNPASATAAAAIDAQGVRQNGAVLGLWNASGVPASANYAVEGDLRVTSLDGISGIALRADRSTITYYALRYNTGPGTWAITKGVAGASSVVVAMTTTLVVGQVYRMRLVVSGSTLTAFINGTQILTATDTDNAAAGSVALLLSTTAPHTSTTGLHVDNLIAYNG